MVSPVFLVNYMSHPGHLSCRYYRCPLSVASANQFHPISDYNLHCTARKLHNQENQKVFVYCLTMHGILCRANMSKLFAPGDALRRSFLKRCAEIQAVKNHLPAAYGNILGGSVCYFCFVFFKEFIRVTDGT